MALNTPALKNALKAAFMANLPGATGAQTAEVDALCAGIATAVQTFVQGATITYTAGLLTPAGGGPVSGVFGNVIS